MCLLLAGALCLTAGISSAAAAVPTLTAGSPHLAGWTGPIELSVAAGTGDDPTDTYTVLWDGSANAVAAASAAGPCQTLAGQPAITCRLTSDATAGAHTLALRDDATNALLTNEAITIQPHLTARLVKLAPLTFTPFKLDHISDQLNMTFILNKVAGVQFQVRNAGGTILKHSVLTTFNFGSHVLHWGGGNDRGTLVTPNTDYWVRLVSTASGETVTGDWHKVRAAKGVPVPPTHSGGGGGGGHGGSGGGHGGTGGTGTNGKCTPGYSPCLVNHGGADYDCFGGSGNGPYYTKPGVVYRVTGSDPYDLDSKHDGHGCEK